MNRVFIDTSALVKLYRSEPNSILVQECIDPNDEIIICDLTPLEFSSACLAWVRRGLIKENDARVRIQAFTEDLENYTVITITPKIWKLALELLNQYAISDGLRPPDSLQLASALETNSQLPLRAIVTTDETLTMVAKEKNLAVLP